MKGTKKLKTKLMLFTITLNYGPVSGVTAGKASETSLQLFDY